MRDEMQEFLDQRELQSDIGQKVLLDVYLDITPLTRFERTKFWYEKDLQAVKERFKSRLSLGERLESIKRIGDGPSKIFGIIRRTVQKSLEEEMSTMLKAEASRPVQ